MVVAMTGTWMILVAVHHNRLLQALRVTLSREKRQSLVGPQNFSKAGMMTADIAKAAPQSKMAIRPMG
jgi:hypothetical protein